MIQSRTIIDKTVLDSILSSVLNITDIDGCNCTWICTADDPKLRTWMHHNPHAFTCAELPATDVYTTYKTKDYIEPFIFIPVDMSKCSYDLLIYIAKSIPHLIGMADKTAGLSYNVNNLHLHTNVPLKKYIVVARLIDTLSTIEREWLSLWDGFDWTYEQSDDHSVWRKWSRVYDSIRAQGIGMGLSLDRMDILQHPKFRA